MRVLVAIDGSDHAHAAVQQIANDRFPAESEVRVISVVEPPYSRFPYSGGGVEMNVYDAMENVLRERARAAVDKAADLLRAGEKDRQLKITTDVLSGMAKAVILQDAEAFGADLIVVGSHGHGKLERFLLGSVSQAVALHAACSVEIVRAPRTQANVPKQPST